jgi:flagellar biosynthesis protein FliR/FlhB
MMDTLFIIKFMLILIRVSSAFLLIPVIFPKGTPNTLKIAFSGVIAFILSTIIPMEAIGNSNFALILSLIYEVINGLIIGFVISLTFYGASLSGALIDLQIGLSMISMYDPTSGSNSTLFEKIFNTTALVIFVTIDGHHMILRCLVESFNLVKAGHLVIGTGTPMYVFGVFINYFTLGIKIAIPVIAVLLMTDIIMGLIARAVPQLNVLILGLPIKILVGLVGISLLLPFIFNIIIDNFKNIETYIKNLYYTFPVLIILFADDKTEDATQKKKSDAKKKGQVAKSKEVSLALTLLASIIILSMFGSYFMEGLKNIFNYTFSLNMTGDFSYNSIINLTIVILLRMALLILPIAVPIMIIGILSNFIQSGIIFTSDPIKPDLSKINPLNGFKRIFSRRSLIDMIRDTLITFILLYIGYKYLIGEYREIAALSFLTIEAIPKALGNIVLGIFIKISMFMLAIALIDFIYQRFEFNKDLRMTKQEIKEEFKQEEGDPEIKGKRRQKQREMASRRMMSRIPEASVIITNPTHFACALLYEDEQSGAPVLVAKGMDFLALKIKEIARENKIPIIENRSLARMIYDKVELEEEIPVELYQAVAEILAFVLKLGKNN